MTQPKEILALVRSRDERGLRLLFEQYGGALNGVVLRIVKDKRVAEEVLQDALLKIWNKIDLYDAEEAGLFAWMMRIARNTALDRVRLRGFQETLKSETFDALVHERETTTTSTARVDVETLTAGLDPKYLEVLTKMYFEGCSASAAAEALDLPLGTVKTRLRKGLQLLRDKIKTEKGSALGALLLSILTLLLLWTAH